MRVAIVHDWLYVLGGAERVLREILRCYPNADVFTLFDVLKQQERNWLGFQHSRSSFLQRIPNIERIHRSLLPVMPLVIEQFDLSAYDLVISSSCAVAKGVITGPDQVHVAYIHTPMRYAWDLQHEYLRGSAVMRRAVARIVLHRIRLWETASGLRPDLLIANSAFIARRIRKVLGREATVIHPPVELSRQVPPPSRQRHFLTAGRLVGYKNAGAIVEAFKLLPELKLIVAGTGPDLKRLQASAGRNVSFAAHVSDSEMRRLMATSRALIFAAEEDFGIIPVEAQAEGTPVLALGRGGARETVVVNGPARTGMFFNEATPTAIAACINAFVVREPTFSREACRQNAQLFSSAQFRRRFTAAIEEALAASRAEIMASRANGRAAPQLAAAAG